MKFSKIIIWIIVLTVAVIGFYLYKNHNGTTSEILGTNLGFVTSAEDLYNSLLRRKEKNQNEILIKGAIFLFIELIIYFYFKREEDKHDPLKHLANLRETSVFSDEEYKLKLETTMEVIEQGKILTKKNLEKRKITSELNSLRDKGIITESEYQEKINLINRR